MSRRRLGSVLVLTTLTGALAIAAPAGAAQKGFKYGVAAADVTPHSAILWARTTRPGNVYLQIRRSGRPGSCRPNRLPKGRRVKSKRKNDLTVQLRVRHLKPGRGYVYRFCRPGGRHSATGRFETAPRKGSRELIRFALSGDQDARPVPGGDEPYWNDFEVWDRIRHQDNDFNVLMGDTIYSDTEVPGYTLEDVALTVKEKWRAYKTNLGMRPWARARGRAAYYGHWDDHEFVNDFSRHENRFPYSNEGEFQGVNRIKGEKLYKRGVRAFRDYNPITYSKRNGIYRSERWGRNLEVFFLDERSFRSSSADYDGACDNPAGSGDPDLAPTAPQSVRNVFAAIAPPLANPVPQECLDAINDPNRTMLGNRQLRRFKNDIDSSKATFKVIFNEVPIQQFYALPYDRWEGYEAERKNLLRFLDKKVDNAVFLTTDVHANMVNDARFNTLGGPGVKNSGILDITTGPIATETFSGEISSAVGNPAAGALVTSLFFQPQPPNGVGMQCAATDQFSYAEVRVGSNRLAVELLDDHDERVINTGDASQPAPPCSRIVIPAE
ncbi:MAG TPA: alkaline phosphatase D family protein [Solirubrobacterales bacterium]|nr:alkaline phosphatase D family protein [Solirubrobacterales bacterium]